MKKYIITGGRKLKGEVDIPGAKNVALKAIVAACLTSEKVVINNVPLISDVYVMLDLVREIGGKVNIADHTVSISLEEIKSHTIPLEAGAKIRTSTLFLAPLLARVNEAIIPNPGGCRIGARPIDRIVKGLKKMSIKIVYHNEDGYFHATGTLTGTTYKFEKNSHTGTETLILAATLAQGKTVIENAALEPEVDSLIELLNNMGAKVKRLPDKKVEIEGVNSLHGANFNLPQDRNEVVTMAVAGILTGGEIVVKNVNFRELEAFLDACNKAGVEIEKNGNDARFYAKGDIHPVDIATSSHPGFMTDWQGPWAVLMTQAIGTSTLHETVYENRFGYKDELEKMGAKIRFVKDDSPPSAYNFNFDTEKEHRQKIEIEGKTELHNAVLNMTDLRSGATIVIAALIAKGTSVINGVNQIERGYENFYERLSKLGADIDYAEDTYE